MKNFVRSLVLTSQNSLSFVYTSLLLSTDMKPGSTHKRICTRIATGFVFVARMLHRILGGVSHLRLGKVPVC